MWLLLLVAAATAQVDDILAEESKAQGATSAAVAPATPGAAEAAPAAPSAAPASEAASDAAAEAAAGEQTPEGESEADAEQAGGWSQSLSDVFKSGALGYLIAGGIFMWPILLLGVLALGVIIERMRALVMLNTRDEPLRQEVRELLQEDKVEEALALCDRRRGPVPAILGAGLRKYVIARRLGYDPGKIEDQVVKGMDDYSVHIVAAMERHLPILATVSSAAPMLGFLGTVQGMVVSFDNIVATMGETNIVQAAADGIKISLLTTVLGLIVGIPAFIAFNYFTSVINRFTLDVEESAAELIEAVTLQLALSGKPANGQADGSHLPDVVGQASEG